jgi:hypothetical protein
VQETGCIPVYSAGIRRRSSARTPPAVRRLAGRQEDYFGYRWWPAQEVLSSSERFYPGHLPALLGAFLDGEEFTEPFELWS